MNGTQIKRVLDAALERPLVQRVLDAALAYEDDTQKALRSLSNKANGDFTFRIEAASRRGPRPSYDVYLYNEVGGANGVDAESFVKNLADLEGDLSIHVNSPGGEVYGGLAVYEAIRRYDRGKTTADVDLAASIASVICCAADEVVVHPRSTIMIHRASALFHGTAEDAEKMTGLLKATDEQLASIYVARTGRGFDDIRAAMKAETFYHGRECVAAKLADRMED